jgi:hypothetical protein
MVSHGLKNSLSSILLTTASLRRALRDDSVGRLVLNPHKTPPAELIVEAVHALNPLALARQQQLAHAAEPCDAQVCDFCFLSGVKFMFGHSRKPKRTS